MLELTDIIRDKVRKVLVLSLAPEELDKYIKDEWDEFFKEDHSGYRPRKSPFQVMLCEEIERNIRVQLKKWMDENFTHEWEGQEEKLVGDMVGRFTPIVMQEFSSNIASQALAAIYQRLQQQ